MAEAATAVADYLKEQNKPIIYITVMNAISLSCDCDSEQGDPVMGDLGIDSRCGREISPRAEELGLGSHKYELVEI